VSDEVIGAAWWKDQLRDSRVSISAARIEELEAQVAALTAERLDLYERVDHLLGLIALLREKETALLEDRP
jgi:hypothetical protein